MTLPMDGYPEQGDPASVEGFDPADEASKASSRLRKSPTAFRTISEVADELHIPQHVLRFWETKFPQVKPLKRGGGRRYYRPDDIALLRRISDLLYIQGYTIKGVQRLLREGGGRLSDNIPPPRPDEREDSEVYGGDTPRPPQPRDVQGSEPAEKSVPAVNDAAKDAELASLQAALRQAEAAFDQERQRAQHLRALLDAVIEELAELRTILP